jgi:hypothetical protein
MADGEGQFPPSDFKSLRWLTSKSRLTESHSVSDPVANRKRLSGEPTAARQARQGDDDLAAPQAQVREPSGVPATHPGYQDGKKNAAHPSNRLIAQLNANWRIIDDPLLWILQRRKGKPRQKNSGWRSRSFCRTRDALLRCIREYRGGVDVEALAKVEALPDWHPDWDRRNNRANLDVSRNGPSTSRTAT